MYKQLVEIHPEKSQRENGQFVTLGASTCSLKLFTHQTNNSMLSELFRPELNYFSKLKYSRSILDVFR